MRILSALLGAATAAALLSGAANATLTPVELTVLGSDATEYDVPDSDGRTISLAGKEGCMLQFSLSRLEPGKGGEATEYLVEMRTVIPTQHPLLLTGSPGLDGVNAITVSCGPDGKLTAASPFAKRK